MAPCSTARRLISPMTESPKCCKRCAVVIISGHHLLTYFLIQRFCFQPAQRITGGFQVFSQGLSQPLVESSMFHIDYYTADIIVRDLFSNAVGFILGRQMRP